MALQKNSWRDLQIEQMAFWDDAPRRGLLALLAFLTAVALMVYWVWPIYEEWQVARTQTMNLQQRYAELVHTQAQFTLQRSDAPPLSPLNPTELSLWIAFLAADAQANRLTQVNIKPVLLDAASTKNKDDANNKPIHSVGQITVRVEGVYEDVVNWWAQVAQKPEVLSMGDIELVGLGSNNVRAQVQIKFAQEPLP